MAIYYCPLEAYKERYTMQLSAPETGWMERTWLANDITYKRIEGDRSHIPQNIAHGVALDATGRSKMCFSQISKLLDELCRMNPSDVIYFDDFWHPGIEAIPYACQVMGRSIPNMYANLWAQSVDEFDFTHGMRHWMRHFEKGIGEVLAGIFVATPTLKDLVVHGGIAPGHKVHATGHPFCSEEVHDRMPNAIYCSGDIDIPREDKVVYSSRWDGEKNPIFFLKVVDDVLQRRPDTQFVICTSSEKIKSNSVSGISALRNSMHKYGHTSRLVVKAGLSKEEYYETLASAKIQINTADQDWISFVLLEASVAGAYPVYPEFRSFPEVFEYKPNFMYERLNVDSASRMVCRILDRDDLWTKKAIQARAWIHERFDDTIVRMAQIMGQKEGYTSGPFTS